VGQVHRRWALADAKGRALVASQQKPPQQRQASTPTAAAATAATAAAAAATAATAVAAALPPPSPTLVAVCDWAAAGPGGRRRPQEADALYRACPSARQAVKAAGGLRGFCEAHAAFLRFDFSAPPQQLQASNDPRSRQPQLLLLSGGGVGEVGSRGSGLFGRQNGSSSVLSVRTASGGAGGCGAAGGLKNMTWQFVVLVRHPLHGTDGGSGGGGDRCASVPQALPLGATNSTGAGGGSEVGGVGGDENDQGAANGDDHGEAPGSVFYRELVNLLKEMQREEDRKTRVAAAAAAVKAPPGATSAAAVGAFAGAGASAGAGGARPGVPGPLGAARPALQTTAATSSPAKAGAKAHVPAAALPAAVSVPDVGALAATARRLWPRPLLKRLVRRLSDGCGERELLGRELWLASDCAADALSKQVRVTVHKLHSHLLSRACLRVCMGATIMGNKWFSLSRSHSGGLQACGTCVLALSVFMLCVCLRVSVCFLRLGGVRAEPRRGLHGRSRARARRPSPRQYPPRL